MNKLLRLIFPSGADTFAASLSLLAGRVFFGLLLASHGWQKLMAFDMLSSQFPDPLGVGSSLSLTLAIFGELICSLAVAFGFLTRLALIPVIFTMLVAFVFAHGASIAEGELAFVYLVAFLVLFIGGAGNYSVDNLLSKRFIK